VASVSSTGPGGGWAGVDPAEGLRPYDLTMRSRFPIVLIVLFGLAAASCAEEAASPLEVVTQAADRTGTAEAARVQMTADLSGSGVADGTVIDVDAFSSMDGAAFEGMVTIGGMRVESIAVDGSYFYAFPDLPPGVEWVEMTADDFRELGLDPEAMEQQQGQTLALLGESGEVEERGTEEIAGVATTRYHVVTDLVAVNEESGVVSGDALEEMRGLLGDEVELDVWIDDDGYVRQMVYAVDLAEAPDPPAGTPPEGVIEYRFQLSEFTDDFEPPARPDPASVISIRDYQPGG
jgi:hypothetical protein